MACTQTFWVSDRSSQVFHYNYSYFAAPFSDALVKKIPLVPLTWFQLQFRSHPPIITEELFRMQKA